MFLTDIVSLSLRSDGRERQSIKTTGSRYKSATISDPYVVAQREDGTIALFVGDTMKGTLSEVTVPLSENNEVSLPYHAPSTATRH